MKKLLLSVVTLTTFVTGASAMYGYHSQPGYGGGYGYNSEPYGGGHYYHSEPGEYYYDYHSH
ncbi:MAG: hypothetical protein K2X28_05195 [Alphaproteobacteria bacterium]|nr:hypothetical protein [Alphaproteobacteria bacterium]